VTNPVGPCGPTITTLWACDGMLLRIFDCGVNLTIGMEVRAVLATPATAARACTEPSFSPLATGIAVPPKCDAMLTSAENVSSRVLAEAWQPTQLGS
jgi:hypothetical protein